MCGARKRKNMTYLTQDVDIHNEQVIEDMVADFDIFLREQYWDGCNAIIDNLRDLGEYTKGIELAKRLTARKMTVPADYGEEKNLRTLDEQIDAVSEWDSPAERNYKEGLRRQREFGVKPVEDLIF